MKKGLFLSLSIAWLPFLAAAQSSGIQYVEHSVQQSLNFDNIAAVLESPQFQIALLLVVGIVGIIWIAYLWGSFKMAYEDMGLHIFRNLQLFNKTIKPQKLQAPHTEINISNWKSSRMNFAPHTLIVDNKPVTEETSDRRDSKPARGETEKSSYKK
ncbi:MAG: hypothetical protein SFU99_05000 [Saprospiraceae bacterium]|nr:hypothetical protein [Saprospiraceae bacterium]